MFFKKANKQHGVSPVTQAQNDYKSARTWMAVRAIVFSLSFFIVLFSNVIDYCFGAPSVLTVFGKSLCGLYPISYFFEFSDSDVIARNEFGTFMFKDMYIYYLLIAAAVILLILYFLSWLLSKRHIGWMVCGLVLCIPDLILGFVEFFLAVNSSSTNNPNISNLLFSFFWLFFIARAIHSYKKVQVYIQKNENKTTEISE